VPGKNENNDSLLPQASAQRSGAPTVRLQLPEEEKQSSPAADRGPRQARFWLAGVAKPWVNVDQTSKRRRCATRNLIA